MYKPPIRFDRKEMIRLREEGWSSRRIAKHMGCCYELVARVCKAEGIVRGSAQTPAPKDKLLELLRLHHGNADPTRHA